MSNSKTEIEMPKNSRAGVSPVQREGELEFGSKDIVKKKHNHFIGYAFFQEFRMGLEINLRRLRPKPAAHRPSPSLQ
jgi:hypothetical protein